MTQAGAMKGLCAAIVQQALRDWSSDKARAQTYNSARRFLFDPAFEPYTSAICDFAGLSHDALQERLKAEGARKAIRENLRRLSKLQRKEEEDACCDSKAML